METTPKETFSRIDLSLAHYLKLTDELELPPEAKAYRYSQRSILKLFLYSLIKGMHGFKTLYKHLQLKPQVLNLIGLDSLPHRTTLSRRFKRIPDILRHAIRNLFGRFVEQGHSDASLLAADSTLMHANGNLWHRKDMKEGRLPSCGNIDTDAHWGVSGEGTWVYGFRMHVAVTAFDERVVPFDVVVEPANIKDSKVFRKELSLHLPQEAQVLLGDGGYDDQYCAAACDAQGVTLITPLEVKEHTPTARRERAALYHDPEVREVFSRRKATVEPFQGRLKSLFDLEYLPMKGLTNVRALVTLAVLAYLLLVQTNLRLGLPMLQLKQTMLALR